MSVNENSMDWTPILNRYEENFENSKNISLSIIDSINEAKISIKAFNDLYYFALPNNKLSNPESLLAHASSLMYAFLRDIEYISDLARHAQIKNKEAQS